MRQVVCAERRGRARATARAVRACLADHAVAMSSSGAPNGQPSDARHAAFDAMMESAGQCERPQLGAVSAASFFATDADGALSDDSDGSLGLGESPKPTRASPVHQQASVPPEPAAVHCSSTSAARAAERAATAQLHPAAPVVPPVPRWDEPSSRATLLPRMPSRVGSQAQQASSGPTGSLAVLSSSLSTSLVKRAAPAAPQGSSPKRPRGAAPLSSASDAAPTGTNRTVAATPAAAATAAVVATAARALELGTGSGSGTGVGAAAADNGTGVRAPPAGAQCAGATASAAFIATDTNPAPKDSAAEDSAAVRGGSAARAHALDDKVLHDETAALRKRFAALSVVHGRLAPLHSADAAGTQAALSRGTRLAESADSARGASDVALLRSCAAYGRASAAVAAHGRAVSACATVDTEQVQAAVAALTLAARTAAAHTVDPVLEGLSSLTGAHSALRGDLDEATRLLSELPGN